ncbi:MAG: hypothetical protein V2J10_06020, partial [Wenzhouxiangella sp.]|nr:hypothetical protein [Wenzhouxiangella sp.]
QATVSAEADGGEAVSDDAEVAALGDQAFADRFEVPEACSVPGVRLYKTVTPKAFATVGDELEFSFQIENSGAVRLSKIALDDPMLGGSVSCQASELEPGQTTTCGPVTYQVVEADLVAGEIRNQATVSAEADGGEAVSDDAEVAALGDEAFADRFEVL